MRACLVWIVLLWLGGCDGREPPAAGLTYFDDIEPLLAKHCLGCHTAGGVAPFALDSFQAAHDFAAAIAAATADRRMPPFNADNSGDCHTFRDARWLSDEEIARIGAWAAAGAPAGKARAATPPAEEHRLASIDATLDPGADYTPNANVDDDYRCFVIDAPRAGDVYLEGFEVRPDHPRMSHHLLLYALPNTQAEAAALAKDAADPGLGYTCYGGPQVPAGVVGGWAPGSAVTRYPEGTGLRLEGGRRLIMQWHYHTGGGVAPDRPRVNLQLAAQVSKQLHISDLADPSLVLVPGDAAAEASVTMPLTILPPSGVDLQGVFPHMHRLGSRLEVVLESGDERECLLNVDRYDFGWQQLYLYEAPIHVERGTGDVRLTCTFDASERSAPVRWGEGTDDEMCLVYFFYTL